mgnify:CR=1 FL=1
MKPRFSIVIPVYKSGEWLESLVFRINKVMLHMDLENQFELILVNDSSPDDLTWKKIEYLAKKYKWIKGIELFFNQGQYKATLCGISKSEGEFIITMDDDFQHLPEDIPKLVNSILSSKDIDCVFGKYNSIQNSKIRRFGTLLKGNLFNNLYQKSRNIRTSSFRIFNRSLGKALLSYKISHPQVTPLIILTTNKISNVEVTPSPRIKYTGNYSMIKLIKEVLHAFINISLLPLRSISFIGIFFSLVSLLIGIYTFMRWYNGAIHIAGYTTIILVITFFSGLILLSIGILSEYITRIIREVSGFEDYAIKRTTY